MTPLESFINEMEHEPIENADPHPKLFSDLKRDVEQTLFDLWQWGCLKAEWDAENNRTVWSMSDFGEEIIRKGVDEIYFEMMKNEEKYNQDIAPGPLDNVAHTWEDGVE